jgi:AbrB family looped-hinge helix DNA binding protein
MFCKNDNLFMLDLLYSPLGIIMKVDLDEVRCITDTALTIKGSRRRITVPAEVVELLNLKNGDKLRWIVFKDGRIHVLKVDAE